MKELQVPFTVDVRVDASQTVKVRAEDMAEIRREVSKAFDLDSPYLDRHAVNGFILAQMNELIEARVDQYMWEFWDFDWHGPQHKEIEELVLNADPAIIPEIPGQLGLGDLIQS